MATIHGGPSPQRERLIEMPIHNSDIAAMLNRMADLLEIDEANPFRVRAYRKAARTIQDLPQSVVAMLAEGQDLSELPGIGKDLAGKIREIVETGRLGALKEEEARVPRELAELTRIAGLGPKRVKILHDVLEVRTPQDLIAAAKAGSIRNLPGFGAKSEEKILREAERRGGAERRTMLRDAQEVAAPLLEYLKRSEGVRNAVIAGSYRRRKETVGDLDILVTAGKGSDVMDRFVAYEDAEEIVSRGTTRSTVILRTGLQVDLRVVPEASYGAALHYFTGSKAHNIAVRTIGVKKGLKINEYGVFKGTRRIAGRTEDEVYAQVGLPYIEPELREDRGEIEAAREGRLPKLVTLEDIRGDLHAHTKASDGRYSLAEMAAAAAAKGYEYLAITDHSKHVTVANGLDEKRLAKEIEEIDRLNERLRGIRLLKSTEVDILEDGSLDLADGILKELDLRICSVHYKFNLSREKQTERVIRAMDNPYFNIFAHPSGRLINQREPYEIDMERIMQAALERGCYLEVNAQPERLDLTDVHCKMAKEMGLKIAISTDAHTTSTLDYMGYGIAQARRGWLEADDVLNSRRWKELKALLKRP